MITAHLYTYGNDLGRGKKLREREIITGAKSLREVWMRSSTQTESVHSLYQREGINAVEG